MIISRDTAYRVVCNIRTPISGGEEEVGTGLFVNKGDDLFIITASHVAQPSNTNTYLIVSDLQGAPAQALLSQFSGNAAWRHHPVADIATIRIAQTAQNQALLQHRFFPYDHMDIGRASPSRDIQLTVLGFPLGLGASGYFSPLSFRTYAASSLITFNRADTKTPCNFFVLENPSIGGYSGGAIFDLGYMITGLMTQKKEKTLCHGFMHGTLSDDTGGKLAAVTPASYLDEWF
ncbi:serine protease [Candidatus Bipolaricaulota bacterium]